MLIYFDRQGAIREIVSSYKLSDGTASFKRAEGNSSANRIYCYFDGLATALPSATAGAMSYRLPDGSTIGPRVSDALETLSIDFDASRDLRYFAYDKDYAFLRFDVPDEVFSLSGLISATASVTIGEATYQFGPITFMVDGEVLAQADIDYSQWRYLISQFARYLPLSGGTMSGAIISEGTGRKATFGDGILTLEDTVYGRKTEIGKYAISADGGNFYYPSSSEVGGTLITDRWSGFGNYLPISGGEITGEITTNNDEIYQKVILGNGRIGVQDTDDGAITYFDANYIERVGDRFYYPEWIENGGTLITNRWSGFDKYAKKTDLEDYATKADLNGYATKKDFDDLKSIVYGIHSLTYNSYEFAYLTTSIIPDEVDGRKVVGGSYAIADWIGGNSVAFNQLAIIPTISSRTTNGITLTNNGDGSVTLSGTATADTIFDLEGNLSRPQIRQGDKVLITNFKTPNYNTYYLYDAYDGNHTNEMFNTAYGYIKTKSSDNATLSPRIYIKNGATINETIYVMYSNLTLMGLDNITSVDEFKALFPLDYYPYNSGEIKSTTISKIESWGANLFNGEFEQGGIDGSTGQEISANTRCRTDYLEVIGGKTYYLNLYNTTDYSIMVAVAYDKDKKHIQNINVTSLSNGLALPLNAKYLRFVVRRADNGNIAPSDLANIQFMFGCIKPYVPYVGKLGEINIPNAPLKMDGVNAFHNTLAFEEQEDGTYNAILTRRIGNYTFTGNEVWNAGSSGYGWAIYNFVSLVGAKPNTNNTLKPNLLSTLYKTDTPNNITGQSVDKAISYNASGSLLVRDTSITSASDMASAIAGKTIYFELATPTTETIATGLTFDKVSFPMEKGGSIEAVYEEVPPTASVDFMTKGE